MLLRRRRKDGALGVDPLCAYDALRAAWLMWEAGVPAAERTPGRPSRTPFFTDGEDGEAWSTSTSQRVARKMAAAWGEDAQAFGG
eukprot:3076392-Pleurochrysis_carterae.AAC.1